MAVDTDATKVTGTKPFPAFRKWRYVIDDTCRSLTIEPRKRMIHEHAQRILFEPSQA
jgi:hypothetical protein